MIAYASRTGNVEYIINKLSLPSIKIEKGLIVKQPYFIFTYTDGLGEIPSEVSEFLLNNHSYCKGVIASGNTNFGVNNFCGSADKISRKYRVPIINKIELRGFDKDYDVIKLRYEEIRTDK